MVLNFCNLQPIKKIYLVHATLSLVSTNDYIVVIIIIIIIEQVTHHTVNQSR